LYLNTTKGKGKSIQFEDITAEIRHRYSRKAGLRGIAMVDINADGLSGYLRLPDQVQDMLRVSFRTCFLLIKKTIHSGKKPKLMAWISAVIPRRPPFLITISDGDLDVYLVTNVMNMKGPNNIRKKVYGRIIA
jgi:hypothetical protein